MSAQTDYWTECVESALAEAAIEANPAQIASVVRDVMAGHENYSMAFYQPSGPSQIQIDLEETQRQLADERKKVVCDKCGGSGRVVLNGPVHSSDRQCWQCRGEGRI